MEFITTTTVTAATTTQVTYAYTFYADWLSVVAFLFCLTEWERLAFSYTYQICTYVCMYAYMYLVSIYVHMYVYMHSYLLMDVIYIYILFR